MATLILADAFTDRPFKGNPAGVCLLEEAAPDSWMQDLGMEMNQAETAFILKGSEHWHLRWFTPVSEVDLCGHATLASAHVMWELGVAPIDEPIRFETKSGVLTCTRERDQIVMDFPSVPPHPMNIPEALLELIEGRPVWFGTNNMDCLIELVSEADVRSLRIDYAGLAEFKTRGFIFTAAADKGPADFVSRFFAPAYGVPEDPVTGSAHCCLGPYWTEKLGKQDMVGYQASKRGGYVGVEVAGDRVKLKGRAVITVRGEVEVPSVSACR